MAYCIQADLEKLIPVDKLAELTTEVGDTPDAKVVADCIARADAEIDSYLGVRYRLPLSPVPPQVKSLSVDIALYHLYSRRSVAPPVRQQKYAAAVAFLRQVAAGQAVVEGVNGEPPGAEREVRELTSATRLFRRDNLGEW